jgi:hypothetical protein
MKKVFLAAALTLAAGLACQALAEQAATAPAMANKEVMQKAFKPDTALVKTVVAGKADETQLREFLAYAQSLHANKPKKGEEAAWKTRTQAIIEATQNLLDKKEGALAALKTATNCATCHNSFK